MVGVPRSTGCRTCVKRRVKCDETRPQCLRCGKLRIECLGYKRPLQFRIQQPDQLQPRQRKPRPRRSTPATPLAPTATADEVVARNLIYEALTIQTKEVFSDWLTYHFPRVCSSFAFRVDVGWMEFLRNLKPSCPPALLWAIRTLITFQMGTIHRNERAIYCARHMYGRGIYHLRSLLQSPAALSDETLAACILLGGYEVLDGQGEKSWIAHTRGIRNLMCARGYLAHRSGMGRTLVICFRPFFIAESFLLREACFLASSEWTSMTDDMVSSAKRGEGERLGLAMDHIFNETAKCPGYYARAQAIQSMNGEQTSTVVEELLSKIYDTKHRLQQLQYSLTVRPSGILMDSMARLTLEGLHSALRLLDQLSATLEAGCQQMIEMDMQCNPTSAVVHLTPIGDWLDRFSLGMGFITNYAGSG
ncbi:hypothetical protein BJY04DRAFT_219780 [Aspergillus karnatakaensis]|uniref:Zn(II)2Cys6 transcription factor domain-containing protein n=1 Tax=Aspergillus karnatakaensis TaxID=1810916 RepID=UPI003CCD3AFB